MTCLTQWLTHLFVGIFYIFLSVVSQRSPSVPKNWKQSAKRGANLLCPMSGGQIRLIAFITHSADIRQILEHIGVEPNPARISPARGPPLLDGVGQFRQGSAAGVQTTARGADSGRIDPTGVEDGGEEITRSSRYCGRCTSNEKRRPKSPFCIKQSSDQTLRRRVAAKPSRPKPSKPIVAGSGTLFGLITTFKPTPVVKLSQFVMPPGSVPDT